MQRSFTFTSKGDDPQNVGLDIDEMPQHENAYPFQGVLCRLDEPSFKPPGGASGHKVWISSAVAQKALPSLIGMPLNVKEGSYSDHDKTNPIGTVLRAWIDGQNLWIAGVLHGKYHPHAVATIKANKDLLGLRYEVGNVAIRSENEDVWHLDAFEFTGVAALLKDAAAYGSKTSIAASTTQRDTWTPAMRTLRQQAQALRWR
jgi:hypothetical protein